MTKIDLNGQWLLTGVSPEGDSFEYSASVPGNTLSAVLNSTPEFDVFYRDHAKLVQKYENYNWVYVKTFTVDRISGEYLLQFDRLDTYCDIYLNDKYVSSCDNGHIPYSFPVSKQLKTGENTLEIRFCSPISRAKNKKPRKAAFGTPERLYVRRTQCTYGWDWTMRFVTCGIGNTALVPAKKTILVDNAYVYTKYIDSECAELVADVQYANYESGAWITAELIDPQGNQVYHHTWYTEEPFMRMHMDVPNPALWYPNGYGESPLYQFKLTADNQMLYTEKVGIRTAKIMQLPDVPGSKNHNKCLELKTTDHSQKYDENTEFSGFTLKVNGKKILCKGANWVPCNPLGIGNQDKKITKLLTLAKAAGVNMLRVWGGGTFESRHFYEECSRLGIMVTQDFLMACGQYPEDETWFLEHLKKEADYIATAIRNQPCLMWWSGDNENAVRGSDIQEEYKGRNCAYKAIAPVLYAKDYMRTFLPSSPYGGNLYASNTVGTTHNTQYLSSTFRYIEDTDMHDFVEVMKGYQARFIAEEPAMGAVSLPTLKRFMTDEDIFGEDLSIWLYHTQSNPALRKELFEYEQIMAQKLFGNFKDTRDRFFKLKYLQCEWIRIGMEQTRRAKWFSSGIIYWMFNDCWPASSGWAIVDYYCLPKAAYYTFKRCAKGVIGSIEQTDGQYRLYLCNDAQAQTVTCQCYTLSGKMLMPKTEVTLAENNSMVVFQGECSLTENDVLILETEDSENRLDRAFFKPGKLLLAPCGINVLEKSANSVTLKAEQYIHAVELEGNAVFQDNYFIMLPGEVRTVGFTGEEDILVNAYTIETE